MLVRLSKVLIHPSLQGQELLGRFLAFFRFLDKPDTRTEQANGLGVIESYSLRLEANDWVFRINVERFWDSLANLITWGFKGVSATRSGSTQG